MRDPPNSYRNDPLFVFDSDGVIQVKYPDLGTQYNPATIPQYSLSLFEDGKRIDCSMLKRERGWSQIQGFDGGLRNTVRWYLEHRYWVESVRTGDYRKWIEANYTELKRI